MIRISCQMAPQCDE